MHTLCMQLKPLGQSLHVSSAERVRGHENDLFVEHIIKPTGGNGEAKLVMFDTGSSTGGPFLSFNSKE